MSEREKCDEKLGGTQWFSFAAREEAHLTCPSEYKGQVSTQRAGANPSTGSGHRLRRFPPLHNIAKVQLVLTRPGNYRSNYGDGFEQREGKCSGACGAETQSGEEKSGGRLSANKQFAIAMTLAAYCGTVLVGITHHEPWADEAQAWLLSRDLGYRYLVFHQIAYEGHPPCGSRSFGWQTIGFISRIRRSAGLAACARSRMLVLLPVQPISTLGWSAVPIYLLYGLPIRSRGAAVCAAFPCSLSWELIFLRMPSGAHGGSLPHYPHWRCSVPGGDAGCRFDGGARMVCLPVVETDSAEYA